MAVETTTTLALHTRIYYTRRLLDNLRQTLVFFEFTDKEVPDNGTGPTVQWSRFAPMAAKTTPLTEGVSPSQSQLTDQRVTALVKQFGDFVLLSDLIIGMHLLGPNKFLDQAVDELSYGARLTVDTLVRNGFGAATGAQYFFGGGQAVLSDVIGSTHTMTADDIRKLVRNLKKKFVPRWDTQHYIGIIGPGQSYDLQAQTAAGTWVDVNKYNTNIMDIRRGEIGKIFGARILESTNLSTLSQSGTISECFFFGKHAVGAVNFMTPDKAKKRFMNISLFIKDLGSSGTADPLNQRATIGYKVNFVSQRLEDSRVQIAVLGETL